MDESTRDDRAASSGDEPASSTGARTDVASFVLRFSQDRWQDAEGDPHLRWRGHVRHVQSDDARYFTDFADAVAFMQEELARLTLESVESAPKDERAEAISESFRLWERFSNTYTDLMRQAMERGLEQGESYQRRAQRMLEQGLDAWSPFTSFAGPPSGSGRSASGDADAPGADASREREREGRERRSRATAQGRSVRRGSGPSWNEAFGALHARLDEIEAAIREMGAAGTSEDASSDE